MCNCDIAESDDATSPHRPPGYAEVGRRRYLSPMSSLHPHPEPAAPAYRRIMHDLLTQVRSGALRPGDPVASERELAAHFGVSVMTARHALKELEIQGIVVRRDRVGTFVAPPRIQFNRLLGFSEQTAARGFTSRSRLLSRRYVDDDPEIPTRLALPSRTRLVRIERLRLANEQPLALEVCYLPAAAFPGLIDAPLDRRSLFNILEHDYGMKLAYADEEVDATSADPKTARLLNVPRGAPVLRVRQVLFTDSGRPIAYSLAVYRSEHYSLVIRRFR